jgi:hypothetical protein
MDNKNYGVRLLFRDKNAHNIETTDVEEARNYLKQIQAELRNKTGQFGMNNKNDELVYVCNTDNLIHAMIVTYEETKSNA